MATVRLDQHKVVATAQKNTLPLVKRTAAQVQGGAKRLAPIGVHESGSGKPKKGKPLAQSITERTVVTASFIRAQVGSRVDHAATIHQGSKAHIIRSSKGLALKFRWERGDFLASAGKRARGRGGFFYFIKVKHPGNKRPRRYLTTPLKQFGRRNGFKVTTTPTNRTFLP